MVAVGDEGAGMTARDAFEWVAVAAGLSGTMALLALTVYIVITILKK